MLIGYLQDGRFVEYLQTDQIVRVYNSDVIISGVKSKDEAIEVCKKNLQGFEVSDGD